MLSVQFLMGQINLVILQICSFANFTIAFSILLVLEESRFVNLIFDGTYPCCWHAHLQISSLISQLDGDSIEDRDGKTPGQVRVL